MTRFVAAVALWIVSSIPIAEAAQDSSSCPPSTTVRVINVRATTYKLQISVRNTCSCQINFNACSQDRPKRCTGGRIGSGETRQFTIDTSRPDGKADYNWHCR
jgi:hypothetical protein